MNNQGNIILKISYLGNHSSLRIRGLALIAVLFKALPLTARCLEPPPRFDSWLGYVRKLPETSGSAVIFAWHSNFLNHLQLTSQDKMRIIEILFSKYLKDSFL